MKKTYEIQGIILKQYPLFEKDKCIELFSPTEGKIKILAKYAQNSQRFGGRLDIANIIRCQVYKGQSFNILTQCDLIQHFPKIRSTLNSISLCLYCIDIIRKVTPQDHANPDLYEVLNTTLIQLNQTPENTVQHQKTFQDSLLKVEGLYADTHTHTSAKTFKSMFENYAERPLESTASWNT